MTAGPVLVFASFKPLPDKADDALRVLKGMVPPTRAEPGNEVYDLYSSKDDQGPTLHLFERYADQDALQAHRDSDHYKNYRATIGDLLREPIDVVVLSEVDAQPSP